ncbi:MAG: tetratricopeptide repeat protein [Simkaniaceae bacterium]|nr:tetratricopeptide repeat protein [Simkaniaceae bacterium]
MRFLVLILVGCLVAGCKKNSEQITPHLTYTPQDSYLKRLEPPFPALTKGESYENWGMEYTVGVAMAKELDLYRAITALKRALILIPEDYIGRRAELQYFVLLSYYLGKRYEQAIETFEESELSHVSEDFPAYRDLLIILYECFLKTDNVEKMQYILELVEQKEPRLYEKLRLTRLVASADLRGLRLSPPRDTATSEFKKLAKEYVKEMKSVSKARTLNALLPGAGYFYVGQKQSAFTAFMTNALTIAAAGVFFYQKNYPAGVLMTSVEAGWYFGGIYGAGEAARLYNERLYEEKSHDFMQQKKLYPVMMISHAF